MSTRDAVPVKPFAFMDGEQGDGLDDAFRLT